jgi:HEPN domain-containing protein
MFDCQQASEKALKGYLVFKNKPVIKTHDLIKLLESCTSFDSEFRKMDDSAS